jgi:two-component sensor histidine kinase
MDYLSGFINGKFSDEEYEKFNAVPEKRIIERTVSLSKEKEVLRKEIVQNKTVYNGVGLPSNFDIRNTNSLGLQLVNAFTAQLNGEIELINRNYTGFRITFPRKSNNELP